MGSLDFDPNAFDDLAWWVEQDRKQSLRIIRLIRDVQRAPLEGPGKPESFERFSRGPPEASPPSRPQSRRNALVGFIEQARRAGSHAAKQATTISTAALSR